MLVIAAVSLADHPLGGSHNHQHQIDPIVPVFNDQFSRGARQQNFFGHYTRFVLPYTAMLSMLLSCMHACCKVNAPPVYVYAFRRRRLNFNVEEQK